MQRRWFLALLAAVALVLTGLAAAAFRPEGRDDKTRAGRSDGPKAARVADWEAFLQEYDEDKDGYLSREETPGWLHHNFARLDRNKDGKVSKDERTAASGRTSPPTTSGLSMAASNCRSTRPSRCRSPSRRGG